MTIRFIGVCLPLASTSVAESPPKCSSRKGAHDIGQAGAAFAAVGTDQERRLFSGRLVNVGTNDTGAFAGEDERFQCWVPSCLCLRPGRKEKKLTRIRPAPIRTNAAQIHRVGA